jgi:hypothetical protein
MQFAQHLGRARDQIAVQRHLAFILDFGGLVHQRIPKVEADGK